MRKMILIVTILFAIIIFFPSAFAQNDISVIYEKASPSVIVIRTFDEENNSIGQGSGFFANDKGDIITNLHVVEGSTRSEVETGDGKIYNAIEVLAINVDGDLVALSSDVPKANVHLLKIKGDLPKVGEGIVTIGSPKGLEKTISSGIISGIRDFEGYGTIIQIDAAISPGSSGGPILDKNGEVVGVATFNYIEGQNLNFGVSIEQIKKLFKETPTDLKVDFSKWNSTSFEQLLSLGRKAIREKNYERALFLFQESLKKNSTSEEAWDFKGASFEHLGKRSKAIECYDKAIELNPKYRDAYNDKGWTLHELGKDQDAITYFEKAIQIDPKWSWPLNNIGVSLGAIGKLDSAMDYWDRAIALDPVYAGPWINKGLALNDLGKLNEALICYDKALEIDPTLFEAWLNKGTLLRDLGRNQDALDCINKAIEIDPLQDACWNNKGVVLRKMGKISESVDCFDKAIELNPESSDAWNNKGTSVSDLGLIGLAIECYDKAIEIKSYCDPWVNKGNALGKQGKYDEAIRCYEEASKIDPKSYKAWYNKAICLKHLGRLTESNVALEKARELGYITS